MNSFRSSGWLEGILRPLSPRRHYVLPWAIAIRTFGPFAWRFIFHKKLRALRVFYSVLLCVKIFLRLRVFISLRFYFKKRNKGRIILKKRIICSRVNLCYLHKGICKTINWRFPENRALSQALYFTKILPLIPLYPSI